MLDSFWEEINKGLAKQINIRLVSINFAFWIGGFVIIYEAYGHGLLDRLLNLNQVSAWTVVLLLIFILIISNWGIQRITFSMLRLFEGYWIWPFRRLRWWLARLAYQRWVKNQSGDQKGGYQDLRKRFTTLSFAEMEQFTLLKSDLLQNYPQDRDYTSEMLFLPTGFGNVMRAAEQYSRFRYGLDAYITWPRFWLLLPEAVRKEISDARQELNEQVQLLTWSILFSIWSYWSILAIIISVIVAFFACHEMNAAAKKFGMLIRSAYDLYRFELYIRLHISFPDNFEEERKMGEAISEYLFEGRETGIVRFSHINKQE